MEIFLISVLINTFKNKHTFTKCLKESFQLESDQHFSFKYFFEKKCSNHKILPKKFECFGCYRHEWIKTFFYSFSSKKKTGYSAAKVR